MYGFELIASLALAVVSAAVCVMSLYVPQSLAPHFWAGAGAFPFLLGLIVCLLSSFWFVDLLRNRARSAPGAEEKPRIPALEEIIGPPDRQKRLFWISILTLVFVFVLIPVFGKINDDYGFMGATFVFICVSLKIFTRFAVWKVVGISVLTAVSIYLIFVYGLLLPMPR